MPDLHERLLAASHDLRPDSVPPFSVVQRRATRRRRHAVALAAAAGAVMVATVTGLALGLSAHGTPEEIRLVDAPPLQGAVVEPTPYSVPTTPATDALPVITPTGVAPLREGEASVPWQLIRLWNDESDLAIQFSTGCHGRVEVRVEETPNHVLVQAVDVDGHEVKACATLGRVLISLGAPLDGRPLLHAATSHHPDASAPRSLAQHFEDAPTWPGQPWFRDGRQVLHTELSVAAGPEHCSWQAAAYLGGSALPAPRDEHGSLWARDPNGVLSHFPKAQQDFRSPATLPSDAAFTGYHQGPVEVWTAPSDGSEYIYLVNGENRRDVERWVRGGGGCA
jgi:hypothetical protein